MKYLDYYKQIGKLGLPIFVSQLGTIVVGFADNIMVGQYSTDALASASFVNNVFNTINLAIVGFTYGLLPLAGALFSQNEKQRIGRLMRNALVLNGVYSLGLMLLMFVIYFQVHHLGQPQELLPLIRPYYLLVLLGLLPVAIFSLFGQWCYAMRDTVTPMWIILGCNLLNIIGNFILIYGYCGAPEMGLVGAGISTLAARWISAIAILIFFFCHKKNKEYRQGFSKGKINSTEIKQVWSTSIPVSLQMAFETGSFSIAAVFTGWIGAIPLAAFQIILVIGMLGFCLYYAVGSAIAVLVSNEAGKENRVAMRRAGWAGYHVMLVLACFSTLCFILFARPMMHLFTSDEAVLSLCITLLFPLALYQLGDATQVTFANALRGTGHVMPMLWIAFVSYIVIGVPVTYLLAFPCDLATYGIVLSFSVSLFLAGVLFLIFFLRATKNSCQ